MSELLLRVEGRGFVAGAVLARFDDGYRCVDAAPILRWAIGKHADEIGRYVKRRHWPYQWVRTERAARDQPAAQRAGADREP